MYFKQKFLVFRCVFMSEIYNNIELILTTSAIKTEWKASKDWISIGCPKESVWCRYHGDDVYCETRHGLTVCSTSASLNVRMHEPFNQNESNIFFI